MFNAKGRFFVVEGIDGSGKSTLARALAEYAKAQGRNVVLTREPGATELGKILRGIVQESKSTIDPYAEILLFAADRAQHMAEIIKPAVERGDIVITDRFKYSSLAYQGFGRGLDQEYIKLVNDRFTHDLEPDAVFYCAIKPEEAHVRCVTRAQQVTRFEAAGLEFMKRVSHGFDDIFKHNPRVVIIDANKSKEEMQAQAIEELDKVFGL